MVSQEYIVNLSRIAVVVYEVLRIIADISERPGRLGVLGHPRLMPKRDSFGSLYPGFIEKGGRNLHERVYDYDVYNDLGNHGKCEDLARSLIPGQKRPYHMPCQTGRGPTKTDDPDIATNGFRTIFLTFLSIDDVGSKSSTLPRRSWAVQGRKITMSDLTTPNPIGTGNVTVINEPRETFEARAAIQHDEHVVCLTREVKDLRGELNQVKDLTNLSITLQSPPPEPRNTTPNPPHFSSLDSPIPKHFPTQHPPSTDNNSLPSISKNPPNQPPTYSPS
ncbi:hypothetical protein BC332_20833 [Capsicum chinense]|nr:hypothetical protein BC332_20833 [Capsicum chinense]